MLSLLLCLMTKIWGRFVYSQMAKLSIYDFGLKGLYCIDFLKENSLEKAMRLCTAKNLYRKFETNIPRRDLRGHKPNFHIHVSVSDLYIPTIDLPNLLQENMWTDHGNI